MKINGSNGAAFLAIAALLCLAPAASAPGKGAEANTAVPASTSGQATRADPLHELERLGFHVFPQPVALPAFSLAALSGSSLAAGDLKGSVTLLNFWATWCPPCRQELPSIERLQQAMKGQAFRIAAVSTGENRTVVEAFLKKNGYTFPVYLDKRGTLGADFASQGIPTTYILDKSGRIIAGTVGSREYDEPALVAALRDLASR